MVYLLGHLLHGLQLTANFHGLGVPDVVFLGCMPIHFPEIFRKAVGLGSNKKRATGTCFFDFQSFRVTKKVYIDILHHLVSPKSKSYFPKQAIGNFLVGTLGTVISPNNP